jgi:folylpolyglutamate synthase/dihydropteroate synthase
VDVIQEALSDAKMPGRFEVLGHQPLVIVDGAHNPAGADVCASVFFEDFDPAGARTLVVGCLRGRDPDELLAALRADEFETVVCCTAPSPRGLGADDVARAARRLGCEVVLEIPNLEKALRSAWTSAGPDDAILVTGSLYVAGAARVHLRSILT